MSALHGPRARRRHRKPQSFAGRKTPPSTRFYVPTSKRSRKLELMAAARRSGWRGKTYKGAKKFERKLERQG